MNFFENKQSAAIKFSSGFPEKLVLLDCETTGVNPSYHRIIEVGVLIIENSTVIKEWQTFINPEVNLPENISEYFRKKREITRASSRALCLFTIENPKRLIMAESPCRLKCGYKVRLSFTEHNGAQA